MEVAQSSLLRPALAQMPPSGERPRVSGSWSGKCRAAIWFAGHDYEQEKHTSTAQRTFDIGNNTENLMFDSIAAFDPESGTTERRGPWWNSDPDAPGALGVITDYSSGLTLDTTRLQVLNRQAAVEVDGFVGHIDGIAGPNPMVLVDAKTTSAGWERSIRGDLLSDPFGRTYVMQMQFYMEGWRLRIKAHGAGPQLDGAALIFFNKLNSQVAYRWIRYDPALVEELKERLSWARSREAPVPDWAWMKGEDIPLACRYCGFREACAIRRGVGLQFRTERDRPFWRVTDKKENA